MARRFKIYNGPMPTTAALAKVTTGTAIKTLLQLKLNSGVNACLTAWGIDFDGSAAATPIAVECLETGTVFATVTAFSATDLTDLVKLDDPTGPNPTTAILAVGTAASGYTSTAEGSIVATRLYGAQQIAPTANWAYQWPLGREPVLRDGYSQRIRVTAGAAVGATCWMEIEV